MRPAMRLGDTEIGQQEGGWLSGHRSAAIGVQRQLAEWDSMLDEGVFEQLLEQGGVFSIGDTPADDAAAEDVEDDIQGEIRPFGRSHQFRYIPRPDLVRGFGQQLRLLVDGTAARVAAVPGLPRFGPDAPQGAG